MNVVFVSPNFPPQFHLFCVALQKLGVNVLGIGDCPPDSLAPEVRASMSEYAFVRSASYEELLRAAGYLTWRHGKIDRIDSLNEFWMGWEARLRDDFNVPGPRAALMAIHRSKTGMRGLFRGAGVPSTEGERVTSPEQVRAWAKQHGFPLVFKPDVGVGAAFTFRVNDENELKRVLAHPLESYVVERFCPGQLTSFDGLTDGDGNIVFCTSHVYSSGVMEMVNDRLDVHYFNRREIPRRLEELGRKVIAAFQLRARFFHIEFFERDGDFTALEINIRPPGGFTTDMMNYSSDIDIYSLWAKVVTGRSVDGFKYQRRYHCAHLSRRFGRDYRIPHEELLRKLGPALVASREIPPVLAAAMGDWMYMVRYSEQAELEQAIAWVEAR